MAAATVLFLCGILLLLLAAHPFLTYPLSLALLSRQPLRTRGDDRAGRRPSVAICLSVFNEEAVIVEKVESLIAHARLYGPATVHIYADGCDDATVALLGPYRDRIDLVVSSERKGKTHGMAVLLARSDSELLMFTDANVRAPDTALLDLAAMFEDPRVGCASAELAYANPEDSAISLMSAVYWRLEETVKALEDRTVGVIGVDGAMFMIRRVNYHAPPPTLIDDLYVSLRVLLDGRRAVRVPGLVVTERSATGTHEEYRRKARIACQALNVHRALWPGVRKLPLRIVYGYVSHRLIKWMMPFLLLGAGLFLVAGLAAAIGFVQTAALAAVVAVIFLVGLAIRLRPAQLAWATAAALAGTGKGVLESVFAGKDYTTWEPAASIRAEAPLVEEPHADR